MRPLALSFLSLLLTTLPAAAQKRAGATKEPTFPEAVEQAKKAFDGQEYGAAVSALQAAIRQVQKLQRTAVLEALPKPDGFTFTNEEPQGEEANPFAAGLAIMGMTVNRSYTKGEDKRIDVEVMANSPMVGMMSMMLANAAVVKADGGEIVEYGKHKALLKKAGDDGHELTILMHDKHLVKATVRGMTADELLALFDQAAVDRLEKPLGK